MANLTGALEAFANTGQGFIAGQQQAQDNQYKNQMQGLAYNQASLDFQQKKLDFDRMQKLSDYSMQQFKPQPVGPQPSQPGQQDPQQQMGSLASGSHVDPEQYTQDMFDQAARTGDITHAEQLGTNLINMRSAQAANQQKQAAMQLSNMKARQLALETTAQRFQGVTDQASYDQARMEIMSDPSMPQSARQGIAALPETYSKPIVDHIINQGQTLSQQLGHQIQQQNLAEKIRVDDLREQNDKIKNTLAERKEAAYEQHLKSQEKVGAINKVPSTSDKQAASAALSSVAPGMDTESPQFGQAIESIASRGLQIMRDNHAVNAEQAMAMAADEAKKNGELETENIPGKYKTILGVDIPGTKRKDITKTTFQSKGNIKDKPIELHQNMKTSDLVDGKFYTFNGKTYQAQDGRLKPVE